MRCLIEIQRSWIFVGAGLVPARWPADPEGRAGTRPAPCMGSVKGGEMDQRTPLAFFLASLLPFWRVSSFAETFLHLDATFFLTLPRRQNLLVDSVLRRGQLVVEADRDIR